MDSKTIGVLGGTGPAGSAVAVRIAAAGYTVLLGSREATKAQAKVDELHALFPGRLGGLRGVDNATAAATDIAILATVADSIIPTATDHAGVLAGRVVVCMANLLHKTPRGFAAAFPPEGSVAEAVQVVVPTAMRFAGFEAVDPRTISATIAGVDDSSARASSVSARQGRLPRNRGRTDRRHCRR